MDSDDEFQSADEFVDAEDDNNICENAVKREECHKAIPSKDDTSETDGDTSSSNDLEKPCETSDGAKLCQNDLNEPTNPVSYRKRPERAKRSGGKVSLPLPTKKTEFKEVIDIVNVAKPEVLIKDIKSHLTSNLNKGLTKIQETSNSLKGLVLGTDPSDDRDGERFVYDDTRCLDVPETGLQSALSEEILKLSNAFARFEAENYQVSSEIESRNQCCKSEGSDKLETEPLLESTNLRQSKVPEKGTTINESLPEVSKTSSVLREYGCTSGLINIEGGSQKEGLVNKIFDNPGPEDNDEDVKFLSVDNKNVEALESSDSWGDWANAEHTGDGNAAAESSLNDGTAIAHVGFFNEQKLMTDISDQSSALKDGWGSWADEVEDDIITNEESAPSSEVGLIVKECLPNNDGIARSQDAIFKVKVTKTNRENFLERSKISNDEESSESCKGRISCLEKDEVLSDEKIDDDDVGWGDWGDEDVEDVSNNDSIVEKIQQKVECGWGEFDEFPIEEGDSHAELDGWGDWGDEDDEAPTPSVAAERIGRNTSKHVPDKVSKTKLRSLQENIAADQDWKGWESFGQKRGNEWGLGGWGLSSLLNTATAVSSNLSAVTQGISTVIESGLGVPDPETLARLQQSERKKRMEVDDDHKQLQVESVAQFPFQSIVSGVGKIVEAAKVQEIGSRVLSGGLDTLETIGKKTMEVLQEGDPGLKRKRALLLGKGQALSHVLREARDKSAAEDKRAGEVAAGRRCHFETVFDDFQGLIHLEALEMLSTQCQLRIEQLVQSLPSNKVREVQDTLEEVKQLCELDEDSEMINCFRETLMETVEPIRNEFSVIKIIEAHDKLSSWLRDENTRSEPPGKIYDKAISAIAELTASATQQFHKGGELLMLKERRKTVEEADSLLQLTGHLCAEISSISEQVAAILDVNKDAASEILVGNLRVESGNAIDYIKQALGLLLPVIQLGAV